jgi:MoaA/NifB/PqqE/SkfB family radical SAM enzyme
MSINNYVGVDDKRRAVAGAHFFSGTEGNGTVSYILNEGYCNIQCQHCYMNRLKSKPRRRDPDQAHLDILSLRNQGYRVQLRGTELIIHDDFINLFPIAQQDYVQTNGLQIVKNPAVLDQLSAAGVCYIIITYPFDPDGLVDIDSAIVDRAIALSSALFGVTVSVIVTRRVASSLHRIHEFCEHVRKLGARAVKFVRLIPITQDLVPLTPSVAESQSVLLEIARLKTVYHYDELVLQTPGCFGLHEFRRALAPARFASIDLDRVYDCPAGIKNIVIDLHNDVYPCLYLMERDHRIGTFSMGRVTLLPERCIPGSLRAWECPAYTLRMASCSGELPIFTEKAENFHTSMA